MANAMKINNDKMAVVPWFSMAEWKEVYKQIFSSDTTAKQKGYERLLVWKARCPSLPAGVECTVGLMQIHLYDQEVRPQISSGQLPPYREQDLRLMYSAAVMRFLNHISGVALEQADSLFAMAKKLHIPSWIVNIRHEVAHGMTMPPLSILREALDFAITWIHEQYWKDETSVTANYVAHEENDTNATPIINKLQDFIELWQALTLYYQVGFEEMHSIPDAKFKSDIFNIVGNNLRKLPRDSSNFQSTLSELEQQKTMRVLDLVVREITSFVKENKKRLTGDKSLATILLGSETFLLGESLILSLNIDESEMEDALPIKLCGLWQEMIALLQQEINILPNLLIKLMELAGKKEESAHRRKLAAIWVREICRGVLRTKAMSKVKESMTRRADKRLLFKSDFAKAQLREEFDRCYPDLKTAFALPLVNLPVVDLHLMMLVMENPSTWTATYLPSLMKLVEPAMSQEKQESLMKVLGIYTNENINPRLKMANPFIPYTIETLKESIDVGYREELPRMEALVEEATPQLTKEETEETWDRSEEYLEWEKCPLGVLPWQRKLAMVDFSMPPETVWTPAQPVTTFETTGRVQIELSEKKINWENMNPKRKKKSRKEAAKKQQKVI